MCRGEEWSCKQTQTEQNLETDGRQPRFEWSFQVRTLQPEPNQTSGHGKRENLSWVPLNLEDEGVGLF
jgi:hypothetical protein